MITLGKKYKDNITGFEGTAVSRTEYLHGCVHVGLQPETLVEGKPLDVQFFDEQRVDPKSTVKSGGPAIHPPSHRHSK